MMDRLTGYPEDGDPGGLQRLGRDCGVILRHRVQVGDIRGVVAIVVNLHRLGIDVRLQRAEGVGKRRQLERPIG